MTSARTRLLVPIPLLIALSAFGLIGIIALLPTHGPTLPARTVTERRVQFLGGADSIIIVRDAADGRTIATIPVAGQGFARGLVHVLQVVRHRYHAPFDAPYELERLDDGRLLLNDPSAPLVIDLEGFSTTNEAVFAAYLGEGGGR